MDQWTPTSEKKSPAWALPTSASRCWCDFCEEQGVEGVDAKCPLKQVKSEEEREDAPKKRKDAPKKREDKCGVCGEGGVCGKRGLDAKDEGRVVRARMDLPTLQSQLPKIQRELRRLQESNDENKAMIKLLVKIINK